MSEAEARKCPEFYANQWKPGQSGNPAGKSPTKPLTKLLKEALEAKLKDEDGNEKPAALMIAEALLDRARKGSLGHIQEVFNRIEGKVPLQVQVGDDPSAITLDILARAKEVVDHRRLAREARSLEGPKPEGQVDGS
jgi:hypothetical protein